MPARQIGAGRSSSRRSPAATTGGACGCAAHRTRRPPCWPIRSRCSPRSTSPSMPSLPRWWPAPRTARPPRTRWCRPCSAAEFATRSWRPRRGCQAERMALELAAELGVTGLLAVELFAAPGGLLVNELAMRPHNSGHWTIEGARTSQFEQHLRAVLDLPLGDPSLAAPATAMANVLGGDDADIYDRYIHVMAADPGVKVHMYGKPVRPGRKIGHVTVPGGGPGSDPAGLADRARRAASFLRWGKEDGE